MQHHRGLWRIQEKASNDNQSRETLPQNNLAVVHRMNQDIATGNNTSHDEDSNTQTAQLGRIVNIDVRDLSPDNTWKLIEPMSASVKRVVICLKGDLKRDRIGGMTLPLYYTHKSKLPTKYQFVFCQILRTNSVLAIACH